MKKILPLFMLILGLNLNAQVIFDGTVDGLMLMPKVQNSGNIEGTPYWNDDFQSGSVYMDGKSPISVYLRYNVRNEQIEIKSDLSSDDIYIFDNRTDVSYVLNDHKIVADQIFSDNGRVSGLFIEHYSGEKYRLLEKLGVKISEAVPARSAYERATPAQMKIENTYYLISNGEAEEVRIKHNDIKKMFESKPAKEYLSDNKIKEVEDLVALLKFIDK